MDSDNSIILPFQVFSNDCVDRHGNLEFSNVNVKEEDPSNNDEISNTFDSTPTKKKRKVLHDKSKSSYNFVSPCRDNPTSEENADNDMPEEKNNQEAQTCDKACDGSPSRSKKGSKSYLKSLKKNIKERKFDLSEIKDHEVITTDRTVKILQSWRGHWPPLREFLQNTVDHLSLLDPRTGRRRDCLTMTIDKTKHCKDEFNINFNCEGTSICRFEITLNRIKIYQQFTFPIASRALETGIVDETKLTGQTAGSFGDGFKSAIVALMADSKNGFDFIRWKFYAIKERTKVVWNFQGLTKDKIATFRRSQVLQIAIDKDVLSEDDIRHFTPKHGESGYVMKQSINARGIGKSFREKVLPFFVVFWDLEEETLISLPKTGYDRLYFGRNHFIGPASQQPYLFEGVLGKVKPAPGVYLQGIYVCKSKISDAIMSFYSELMEVQVRERDQVDEEELVKATIYILKNCKNISYLKTLMEPLRGNQNGCENTKTSWLLKPQRFFNRIIEDEKEFILHDILEIPEDTLIVSEKAVKMADKQFFYWATNFLEKNNRTLIQVPEKANKLLFVPTDLNVLTDICATILRQESRKTGREATTTQTIVRKFIAFLGIKDLKRTCIVVSANIDNPFIHDNGIYMPDLSLNQSNLTTVISTCLNNFDGQVRTETYTALIRALIENFSAHSICTRDMADRIVTKAREIKKLDSAFIEGEKNQMDDFYEENPHFAAIDKKIKELADNVDEKLSSVASENCSGDPVVNDSKDEKIAVIDLTESSTSEYAPKKSNFAELKMVEVGDDLGGGRICCDWVTCQTIKMEKLKNTERMQICILRDALNKACKKVADSIPSTSSLIDRIVHHGFNTRSNKKAYSDGLFIIVNIFPFLSKVSDKANSPSQFLINEFIILLTGEIAHRIEAGPGQIHLWRKTQLRMINQVMQNLER